MSVGGSATQRLARQVATLLRADDPVLRPLGDDWALVRAFEDLEARTTRSVWTAAQRHIRMTARGMHELNGRSRARGIEERSIYSTPHARSSPLLTSFEPRARIGPVPVKLLVVDEEYLVVPGPDGVGVSATACGTDDPDLVRLGIEAFEEMWSRSAPWQEVGLHPRLPQRRFQVALLLLEGYSDREVADELQVGARTVSQGVREVVAWLGARNRAHAIAMLAGAA